MLLQALLAVRKGPPVSYWELPDAAGWALAYLAPVVDLALTLVLGGRPAPLSPLTLLNPVVVDKLMHDPGEGWKLERAVLTPALLQAQGLLSFEEAVAEMGELAWLPEDATVSTHIQRIETQT